MADLNNKEVHLKQKEYIINKLLEGNNNENSYKSLYGNDLQNFFTSSAKECKKKINFILYLNFIYFSVFNEK